MVKVNIGGNMLTISHSAYGGMTFCRGEPPVCVEVPHMIENTNFSAFIITWRHSMDSGGCSLQKVT